MAIVLSGGGINGVLMELGFLKRVRETSLWPRIGWIYGTSAGAFAGAVAVLDRLDEFEAFMLELKPDETFRPNRLWQLPLLGLHEYALPDTIAARFGDLVALSAELSQAEMELVVIATDATPTLDVTDVRDYELVYSSRRTEPVEMAQAILASAAISALADRDRRRLGTQLPACARVRRAGRRRDRGLPLRPALSTPRHDRPCAPPAPARTLRPRAAGACVRRGAATRGGA